MLIEQLSYTLLLPRVVAKLTKLLMGVSTFDFSAAKVLKLLTPLPTVSNLAEIRMNTGFRLSCSMSILGEHLRRAGRSCGSFLAVRPADTKRRICHVGSRPHAE